MLGLDVIRDLLVILFINTFIPNRAVKNSEAHLMMQTAVQVRQAIVNELRIVKGFDKCRADLY